MEQREGEKAERERRRNEARCERSDRAEELRIARQEKMGEDLAPPRLAPLYRRIEQRAQQQQQDDERERLRVCVERRQQFNPLDFRAMQRAAKAQAAIDKGLKAADKQLEKHGGAGAGGTTPRLPPINKPTEKFYAGTSRSVAKKMHFEERNKAAIARQEAQLRRQAMRAYSKRGGVTKPSDVPNSCTPRTKPPKAAKSPRAVRS